MLFAQPHWLWLLLVPAVLLWYSRHTVLSGWGRPLILTVIRIAALVLLVLALAGPWRNKTDVPAQVIAVVDLSASVDDAALAQVQTLLADRNLSDETEFQIVGFADRALVLDAAEVLIDLPGYRKRLVQDGRIELQASALAEGLQLAGALRTQGAPSAVIDVYSDGRETDGAAWAQADVLGRKNCVVNCIAVETAPVEETLIRETRIANCTTIGSMIECTTIIETDQAQAAQLSFQFAGENTTKQITLESGMNEITHALSVAQQGLLAGSVQVYVDRDTYPDNNRSEFATYALPARQVVVLEDDAAQPVSQALRHWLGRSAEVRTAAALQAPEQLPKQTHLLVIGDTPADRIDPALLATIDQRVRQDGMGLLMTGGRRAFGPGGYGATPLAETLPVSFAQTQERRDPSTTLVVIIDTSGSMSGPRVDLAKEIARLAIARLKPHDKVGIVEFYGSKRWAAPIQPASNAIDIQRALNRLSAGGGTVILPAIEESFYALQNVRTRTRHVLVLTDGGVESGQFEPLIRKMAQKGITLSTVLVGPGAHSSFLASLAQWGHGRFYWAPDRFNLPEIIVKQPESSLLSPFVERPVAVMGSGIGPVLQQVALNDAPALQGYVETTPRNAADVLLASELGHPILAAWSVGAGRSAVWTTQLAGQWSAEWSAWPGHAQLVRNLTRYLFGVSTDQALAFAIGVDTAGVSVLAHNRIPGVAADVLPVAPLSLRLQGMDGEAQSMSIEACRPNQWYMHWADLEPGAYEVRAELSGSDLHGYAAFTVPAVCEMNRLGANNTLMAQLEQTAEQARREIAQVNSPAGGEAVERWPAFVIASLILFLLGILIRRWPLAAHKAAQGGVSAAAVFLVMILFAQFAQANPADLEQVAGLAQAVRQHGYVQAADDIHAWIDRQLSQTGQLDDLLNELAQAQLTPAMQVVRGEVALYAGDLDTARSAYAVAGESLQQDAAVLVRQASVCESHNDIDATLTHLARARMKSDGMVALALCLRQASLLYDQGRFAEATDLLRPLQNIDDLAPEALAAAGRLAGLYGDVETAALLLDPQGQARTRYADHLLRGQFLLQAGRPQDAQAQFVSAYRVGPLRSDRRFALERLIAAHRASGTVADLADAWLASDLGVDQALMLVGVLRELTRADEALDLLQRLADDSRYASVVQTPEFHREVISVAVEADQLSVAEIAYRLILNENPADVASRVGLARLLLLDDRQDAARQLLRDGADVARSPGDLIALAEAAQTLYLNDEAVHAAQRAAKFGPEWQVRAAIFRADLLRANGDTDAGVALLQSMDTSSMQPREIWQLAEAFERFGQANQALDLYEELYQETASEDTLLRALWLQEQTGQTTQAYQRWKQLWQTTEVPARLIQAQQRTLELAAKTDQLADLAIELEERLDSGDVRQRDVEALVAIYTLANDPISAVEVLSEYRQQGSDQVATLQRMVRVYLDSEQFGLCYQTLLELVELDTAHAADYLQQIAVVAIERQQPRQARQAMIRLRELPEVDWADEFSAGVLTMLEQPAEAAQAYGRLIAGNPDRVEAWLLWANVMRQANQTERAIARFQTLLIDSQADDLFTIAVDGLLNLDAPPAVLRQALRQVRLRIALQPQKSFLYRLAADVQDVLGDSEGVLATLELATIPAGQRRGFLLRELMDTAMQQNRAEQAIDYGMSLIALRQQMPPQVYLDLGDALIKQRQFTAAERVFDRLDAQVGMASLKRRVASSYEQAGMPLAADRIIRELLMTEPDDTALLVQSGTLREQYGDLAGANQQYCRAMALIIGRLPATADAGIDGDERRSRRAANQGEIEQYFEPVARGLLSTVATAEQRQALLDWLETHVRQELDVLDQLKLSADSAAANHPRLKHWCDMARRASFALHEPNRADKLDTLLVARFAQDESLIAALVKIRLDWQLMRSAESFARMHDRSKLLAGQLLLERIVKTPDQLDDLLTEKDLAADAKLHLAGACWLAGHDELAGQILGKVVQEQELSWADGASLAGALADVLERPGVVERWHEQWLDTISLEKEAKKQVAYLENLVGWAWPKLDERERMGLANRIARIADKWQDAQRLEFVPLQLRLSESEAVGNGADVDQLLQLAIEHGNIGVDDLAELLALASPEARLNAVTEVLASQPAANCRIFILRLVGKLRFAGSDALAQRVLEAFRNAPSMRCRADRVYSTLCNPRWQVQRVWPELAYELGEILLTENADSAPVLAVVATTRHNAGRQDEASGLVLEALDTLLTMREPDSQSRSMLQGMADVLDAATLDDVVADAEMLWEIDGPTPMNAFIRAIFLEKAGRLDQARQAYRDAFMLASDNRTISRRLIVRYERDGYRRDLAELLATHLTKSTIMESYEWRTLADLYSSLQCPVQALAAAAKDMTPLGPIHVMTVYAQTGRDDDLQMTLRRFWTTMRNDHKFFAPFWPEQTTCLGLQGFEQSSARTYVERERMFAALADKPFAAEQFRLWTQAITGSDFQDRHLVEGLARASVADGSADRLWAELLVRSNAGALHGIDQQLLVELAASDRVDVPAGLCATLDDMVRQADPTDTARLHRIARLYDALGEDDAAQRLARWVLAYHTASTRRGGGNRNNRLDEIKSCLALLPEQIQADVGPKLIHAFALTPFDNPSEQWDTQVLQWLEIWEDPNLSAPVIGDLHTQLEHREVSPVLCAALARYAVLHDDTKSFERCAREVLDYSFGRLGMIGQDIDLRLLLPEATATKHAKRFARTLHLLLQSDPSWPSIYPQRYVRHLAQLADWARDQEMSGWAKELLQQGQEIAPQPGEHLLWLADVWRRMGDSVSACRLEQLCLEAGCLPIVRVEQLLTELAAQSNTDVDGLACAVAGYSDAPAVLRRARQAAIRQGDMQAAEAYRQRLEKAWPGERSGEVSAQDP